MEAGGRDMGCASCIPATQCVFNTSASDGMDWDVMGWVKMSGLRWDERRWDETHLDGIEWNGWDGME